MSVSIREMADADQEQADEVLKLAFNSSVSRLDDLKLYRRLQPDGWFAAFDGNRLIGTVGAASYGVFAHVGFMTVHPEFQGQGIGRKLMEFLLAWLEQQKVPLVTLDASAKGHPLYLKLGFSDLDETLAFQYHGESLKNNYPPNVYPITSADLNELVLTDTEIFGADRSRVFQAMLDAYPTRAFLQRSEDGKLIGYLFAHQNRIGPWVMLGSESGEPLMMAALTLPYREAPMVHVPDGNQGAVDLLTRYGFVLVRSNKHMIKGASVAPGRRLKVWAQTSLGVG